MYLQVILLLSLVFGVFGKECVTGRFGGAYWKGMGDTCYGFYDGSIKTKHEAHAFCRKEGGYLAMPKSKSINDFLAKVLNSLSDGTEFIFGLEEHINVRKGTDIWKWSDGTRFYPDKDFNNFEEGHGSSAKLYQRSKQRCATMDMHGKWQSSHCGEERDSPYKNKFICQRF